MKESFHTALYHSPLRVDLSASFKVDLEKNLWIDYGTNKGGTMIDLVMKFKHCSLHTAMVELEQIYQNTDGCFNRPTTSFSFQGNESTPSITIQNITELVHPALLQYLDKRAINVDLAREHCKQVHYSTNGKTYFAIGFKNDTNGWNLRSDYFKGCTSMDSTTQKTIERDTILVFEGFMDYLSYLAINNLIKPVGSIIVLNSTSNLNKAIAFIKSQDKVYTYLDNDEGGRKATQQIKELCKTHFNKPTEFANFKDLNEYHVANQKRQIEERKPSRGFRL